MVLASYCYCGDNAENTDNDCTKCYKVDAADIEFNTESRKKTKRAKRQKTSFPKESVENAGFYKPVLNKIMTTEE